jgi:hypothetical protein
VHTANAGAFVALLRRLAPHPGHVVVADLPMFLIEVAIAALLLGMTGEW